MPTADELLTELEAYIVGIIGWDPFGSGRSLLSTEIRLVDMLGVVEAHVRTQGAIT